MQADVRLSTRFLTTQNAHQVGVLLTLAGETPVRRPPINVALVLDRSGSMSGAPLAAAKEAAIRFASFLTPGDRLSLVVFDERVGTIYGPAPAGSPAAAESIAAVHPGGSTNLSGGWLKGLQHVAAGMVQGTNRVVLLTDGQANVGLVEPARLVGLARGGLEQGVTTTCIGFGASFNEELLEPMAGAGGGNYWYVERDDQMAGIFEGEVEGLVSLAAQNVEVEVRLAHPGVAGVSFLQSYPVQVTPEGAWRVALHDLYGTSPRSLGLVFHVEEVAGLGKVRLGEIRVEADVVLEGGIEHRTVILPVVANLDAQDHVEPVVERTFLRFAAAKAREDAVRLADDGDFAAASVALRTAAAGLRHLPPDSVVADEIHDLEAAAEQMDARVYESRDRKYHAARAMASRDLKAEYAARLSRRPDPDC